ncbi:MAG: glycosyltransferase family 2 protein [Ferruginibacter sp.]
MNSTDVHTQNTALPLVSCIMPTYNRRAFVSHAIRFFLRQDYENKELLIADDGTDCIRDLVPHHDQIRYIRLPNNMTLGEKRNFCVRESKGDLIMHWDDDDWMAPYRISYQVRELLLHKVVVCGLKEMLFCEYTTGNCWLYKYPFGSKPWLAGGSLLYTREFWKQSPFPDIQVASDTQFIWSRKMNSYIELSDYKFYVATIHKSNTSPKITSNNAWSPFPSEAVADILGDDWPVYLNLQKKNDEQNLISQNNLSAQKQTDRAVSVCLLSYKRPENIQPIINSIHQYDFIDEILIWNNNPSVKLQLQGEKVKLIESPENMMCYGRFLCARLAKNELIYVQDDDAIVNNIPVLYKEFLKNSTRITHALYTNHYRQLDRYYYFPGQVALLGWGAFFKRSWLATLDKFLLDNENDYLFRREADHIFTLSLGVQHCTIPASLQFLNHHSTPGIALYLEPEHNLHKALAVNKALAFTRKSKTNQYPVTWNIVIPCKNYGKYLRDAVKSVLYNTADYIITIVDDNSTDNTQKVGLQLASEFSMIKYIRLPETKGVSFARNHGIASAESIFVVLLDADDKIGPKYLFDAERVLRKGADIVNPDAILFGDENLRWEVPENISVSMLLNRNQVHTSAAFRRSYWAQVGGIDESMENWQDYEFWIRLAAAGARIKRLPGDHFFYRKHGYSKSSESKLNSQRLKDYIRSKHTKLFQSFEM